MECTLKAKKSYVIFAHEFATMNFSVLFHRKCNCGCGYYQIFGFDEDRNSESIRLDVIMRDETRHMYE